MPDGALTESEIAYYHTVIESATGLKVQKHQSSKLEQYLNNIKSTLGSNGLRRHIEGLSTSPDMSKEYIELLDILTIGESYFFRDAEQMHFLRYEWLPRHIEASRRSGEKSIRIWSAGCSEGQELYSIAIILYELLDDIQDWKIHLVGTDINHSAIEKAINGAYSKWSIRDMRKDIVDRFFEVGDKVYLLDQSIRRMCSFFCSNLLMMDYPSILSGTSALDIIICRNVLLYFDEVVTQNILRKFSFCLNDNGILLLGLTDAQFCDIPDSLSLKRQGEVLYYMHNLSKVHSGLSVVDEAGILDLTTQRQKLKVDQQLEDNAILEYYLTGDWKNLISSAEGCGEAISKNPTLLLYKALAFLHIGALDEGMQNCQSALAIDELDPRNYLLQALIYQEMGDLDAAENALRKSIFLEDDFVDARYFLGLVLFKQNKKKQGLNEFKLSLEKLNEKDCKEKLFLEPTVTFAEFKETLMNEIRLYED